MSPGTSPPQLQKQKLADNAGSPAESNVANEKHSLLTNGHSLSWTKKESHICRGVGIITGSNSEHAQAGTLTIVGG